MLVWKKFKTSKIEKEQGELRQARKNLNVNEEYVNALRTQSYTDFFTKAQLLVYKTLKSPSFSGLGDTYSQILLEPCQEIISNVVESTKLLSKYPDLKTLMVQYFNISAEASKVCTLVLEGIIQVQLNYQFLRRAIGDGQKYRFSSQPRGMILSELKAFASSTNPFSCLVRNDFQLIQEEYSTVLHHLKSSRKKMARKVKLIKYFKKACGVFLATTSSLASVASMGLASHTPTSVFTGPDVLNFRSTAFKEKKNKAPNFRFLRSGTLLKVGDQLDIAAKGTYILDRDFDTMSRTVSRLQDEIEHDKSIIKFCLKRKTDSFSLQEVVKELRKSDTWVRNQLSELEEHVFLCLVTINRARMQVMKEMSACAGN